MAPVNMEGLLADIELREKRARTIGMLFILIPLAMGLGILAYAGVQIGKLHKVSAEVQDLLQKKKDVSEDLRKTSEALDEKKRELALANTAIRQADRTPGTEAALPAHVVPRIYIQIRNESQRAPAEKVANVLRSKGWVVPGIEQVDAVPNRTQVRYYRINELGDVEQIVQILQELGIQAELTRVPGYESSPNVRPRHYEIWFSANAFRQSSSSGS